MQGPHSARHFWNQSVVLPHLLNNSRFFFFVVVNFYPPVWVLLCVLRLPTSSPQQKFHGEERRRILAILVLVNWMSGDLVHIKNQNES